MGYFRPVIDSQAVPDADIELLRGRFRLPQGYRESYAVTMDDLRAMSDRGDDDEQGLRKPVNDLSRGARVADIVNTVAITAIQAQLPL